ncbi:hypothetical protein ABK040_016577 [Willaertia magna]
MKINTAVKSLINNIEQFIPLEISVKHLKQIITDQTYVSYDQLEVVENGRILLDEEDLKKDIFTNNEERLELLVLEKLNDEFVDSLLEMLDEEEETESTSSNDDDECENTDEVHRKQVQQSTSTVVQENRLVEGYKMTVEIQNNNNEFNFTLTVPLELSVQTLKAMIMEKIKVPIQSQHLTTFDGRVLVNKNQCFDKQEAIKLYILMENEKAIQLLERRKKSVVEVRQDGKVVKWEDKCTLVVPKKCMNVPITITNDKYINSTVISDSFTVSDVFEITPHDVKLPAPVKVTLKYDKSKVNAPEMINLYKRAATVEAKELDLWTSVPIENLDEHSGAVTVELSSFSSIALRSGNPTRSTVCKTKDPNYQFQLIFPGVNYQGKCNNSACKCNGKEVSFSARFGADKTVRPNEDLNNHLIKCPSCNVEFNAERIVLYKTKGTLSYCLGTDKRDLIIDQTDSKILMLGVKSVRRASTFTIKIDFVGVNPQGVVKSDLVGPGALADFKMLTGKFYSGEGFTKDSFEQYAGKALDDKQLTYECYEDEVEFTQKVKEGDYDVLWVISSPGTFRHETIEAVVEASTVKRKGLLIWGDNDPYYVHANELLKSLSNFQLTGNTCGKGTTLQRTTGKPTTGYFTESHPIMAGIDALYEGNTICYPVGNYSDFEVLAQSSENNPAILCSESNSKRGRIIVDCGFTKLFEKYWTTIGTARYVINAGSWLTGI